MKIKKVFKLFLLLSISLLVLSLQSLAEIQYSNVLSKIIIDENQGQNYDINLVFENKFDGNAFIQKRQNGSYYVFVPDTAATSKNIKIIYKDGKDKTNIKIKPEESVYQKDDTDTAYVKLNVDITGDYSIQLYSKTVDEISIDPVKFNINWGKTICGIILLLAVFTLFKIVSASRKNKFGISNIISAGPVVQKSVFPSSLMSAAERSLLERGQVSGNKENSDIASAYNFKKDIERAKKDSFSCFDIPLVGQNKDFYQDIEINSKIKQPSMNLYETTIKSKVTNPITKVSEEETEFSMPVVEDIVQPVIPIKEVKKDEPELLSELRITPTKGFYLTTIDDTFALFGFVGQNIFLLNKFSDLSQINLQARFYDRQKDSDLYIVRLDSYKAMVEISDKGMKELAVL